MLEFFNTYGFLLVTLVQSALLGLSLYFPLSAGQLSLASPGFYALGGYVAAVLGTNPELAGLREAMGWWIYPLAWLISAIFAGVLALVIGIPVLKLRGIYLALATIAFVEVFRILALNLEITGGAIGLTGIPQYFSTPFGYMAAFLPLLVLALWFAYKLERSRTGRAIRAIREDELAADAMGINPMYYKVLTFVIGATLAGIVGAMSAPFLNTWNPSQGTFDASINILAFVLIGGSRNIWGPVLGAILLTALPEVLRPLKDFRLILNGLVLVVSSIYLPQGLAGLFQRRAPKKPVPVTKSVTPPVEVVK